jgi:hypothetical protein
MKLMDRPLGARRNTVKWGKMMWRRMALWRCLLWGWRGREAAGRRSSMVISECILKSVVLKMKGTRRGIDLFGKI